MLDTVVASPLRDCVQCGVHGSVRSSCRLVARPAVPSRARADSSDVLDHECIQSMGNHEVSPRVPYDDHAPGAPSALRLAAGGAALRASRRLLLYFSKQGAVR